MQDIQAGTIDVISSNRYGVLSKGICLNPFFSPDGKKVAFWTTSIKFSTAQTTSRHYELIVKDIGGNSFYYPNTNESNVFGNGDCPLIENNDLNRKIYNAAFSPDSTKILFTSHSTNLIDGEFNLGIIPDSKFRWYVKDLYTGIVTRVASTANNDFGDLTDDYEALWYDNDNIVFTTYSNNLITENGYSSDTQDVYIKNIATGELSLVSRLEDGNISPFLNFGCYNIDVCAATNTVSFFSAELGYCIKNLLSTELIQVQNLTGLLTNSIISAEFFNFSSDGERCIFRLSQNVNTFPNDLNEQADDFIYNFTTNQIEFINESSTEDFGNSTSKDSTFNISGNRVAFLSDSTNLDPLTTNGKFHLYVKNLINGDITRISSSTNTGVNSDILGYCWLSDTELCFTTRATNISLGNEGDVIGETINWFYRSIFGGSSSLIQINSYNMDTQFSDYNEYNRVLRKELFDNEIKRILFVTNPEQLNYAVNSQGYNVPNVFAKTFKNSIKHYPTQEQTFAYPTESINSTVMTSTSADAYTNLDNIVGVSTTSIIGSTYVERVNSIQHRNDNDSSIRWMSLTFPELPDSMPAPDGNQSGKFGAGIFLATNTLCDDFMTYKISPSAPRNAALIGTLAYFNVSPRNDVVIITAGDPQYQICAPIVYLQATIRGNESGHTFLWEQLVGSTVILTQNSNTQAYFTTVASIDFVFRFWIDKGRVNEQYQDITVYTTPTSFSSIQKWSNNAFNNTNIIDQELYSNSPILLSHTFDISIPFNSSGTTVDYNIGIADWSLPNFYNTPSTTLHTIYNNNFVSTILQGYDSLNSIWYDLTEKNYNEVREFIGLTPIIRIGVKYKPLGHDSIIYYGNPQRITDSISGKTNLSRINYSNTIYNNTIRLVYVLVPILHEDNLIKQIHTNSIYSNTQRVIYTLIDIQNSSDINKTIWSNVKIKFNITRTNGSNIGG